MFLTTNDDSITEIKNKNKKIKKKKFKFIKFLFTTIILLILIMVIVVGVYTFKVISNIAPIDPTKISDLLEDTSFIYDSENNLLERVVGSENRTVVSYDVIPENTKNAIIAIEDERFFEHNGVDVQRVFGSMLHNIKTMSFQQGASTITMQLAKNLYTGPDRSIERKITDAYNAIKIEKILDKEKILYYYLNQINLGRGNYGLQAASNHYFNKDISEINLAESAILAGITKNPSRYSVYTTVPITLDDDLDSIQIRLLPTSEDNSKEPTSEEIEIFNILLKKGKISRYEYSQLKTGEYYVRKAIINEKAVERQKIVLKMMLKNGFISEQEYDESINTEIKINIGKNRQSNISSYFADKVKTEVVSILKENGYTEEEAKEKLLNGGLRIYSTLDPKIQSIVESEINNPQNYPRTRIDEQGVQQPQVASVVIENGTGYVRGFIGGRGISGNKIYNRAINPRQPGSSIKPIAVYLPALENGFTPGSPIDDSPITEGEYQPKNYSYYSGPTTIRNLIIQSSNVGAVKVAKEMGSSIMIEKLKQLGISTLVTSKENKKINDNNLSLALGGMTKGTTPLDMAVAYGAIANNGIKIDPIFVKKIETSGGTLIYESKLKTTNVTSHQIAYLLTDMLEDVVSRGTGARAKVYGQATAGKTGTTNDEKDVWFVGYTPYYSASVWIGEDIPKDLNMTSDVPSALWGKIMNKIHKDLPSKNFIMPSGIVGIEICDESGLQAGEFCTNKRKEIFLSGTTPKEICNIHEEEHEAEEGLLEEEIVTNEEVNTNETTDNIVTNENQTTENNTNSLFKDNSESN